VSLKKDIETKALRDEARKPGLKPELLPDIIEHCMDASGQEPKKTCQELMGPPRFLRVQPPFCLPGDFRCVCKDARTSTRQFSSNRSRQGGWPPFLP